jgi:hypothetical protein
MVKNGGDPGRRPVEIHDTWHQGSEGGGVAGDE